jgi:hypothetical protein
MSEPKRTAGKWLVKIVKGSYKRPALVVCGEKVVAHCWGDQLDPGATSIGEATANAQLIAAAPELYEALAALAGPEIDEHPDDYALEWRRARVVLAKARGETP